MNRLDRIIASDSNQEKMSLQEFKVLQVKNMIKEINDYLALEEDIDEEMKSALKLIAAKFEHVALTSKNPLSKAAYILRDISDELNAIEAATVFSWYFNLDTYILRLNLSPITGFNGEQFTLGLFE